MPTKQNLKQEITWNEYTGSLDTAPDDERNVLIAIKGENEAIPGWFCWHDICEWRWADGGTCFSEMVQYWVELPVHPETNS